MKLKELLKTKKMRYGINATALTALFIVVILLVNVLAGTISEKFPSINIDLSENGQFAISKATKEAIKDIDKEIKFTGILYKEDKNVFFEELFSRYKEINGNILSLIVDPAKEPAIIQKYPEADAMNGSLVVECGDRYEVISYGDLYGEVGRMEDAESLITNAIVSVTSDEEKTILFTTGHGEKEFETLIKTAESKFFNVGTIDLRKEKIENCSVLAICAPVSDFNQSEIAEIERYVSNGGNVQIYFNPESAYPYELAEYIKEWGIEVKNETVLEKNQNNVYANYNGYLPLYAQNSYTEGLDESILYRQSLRVDVLTSETYGITNYPILTTTNKATTKKDTVDLNVEGTYNIAVMSEKVSDSGITSKLFVSGGTILFEEEYRTQFIGNADLAMATLRGMLPSGEFVKIETKKSNAMGLQMTIVQVVFVLAVLFIIAIAILIIGITKWSKRRYL